MTTIESQTGNQEAIAGLAALVGDVAQDNARMPGQTASAFGALMGSLGQEAQPARDEAVDTTQVLADDVGAEDMQVPLPQPQLPGDALMRAMWPVRQSAATALAGTPTSMGDALPRPVLTSVGESTAAADEGHVAAEAPAGTQASQGALPASFSQAATPADVSAAGGAAGAARPQGQMQPQADAADTIQATRLEVVPAPGMPRAPAPQASPGKAGENSAEGAPPKTFAAQDADSVMAWQRAAYAQSMAMPAPQQAPAAEAEVDAEAPTPRPEAELQNAGEGNRGTDDMVATSWRASSAPAEAFSQVRASTRSSEPAPSEPAAPAAPEASAKTMAAPAASIAPMGRDAASLTAPAQTPPATAVAVAEAASAQAQPVTQPRDSARRDDGDAREDTDETEEAAAAPAASQTAASFFPASMMPPAVQPAPVTDTPAPERAAAAPRFDAVSAFERSAQARSLSRSSAAAEARDSEAAEASAATATAADAPKAAGFQQALHGSQAALVHNAEAPDPAQAAQAAQGPAVPREAVSHELSQAITQGANRVQMRIVPEGLGELDIKVQMTGQQVHLTIRGDAPELAQLLSHKVHELRQDLQSQGLNLEAMDFGALASGSQGSFGQEGRSSNYGGPNQGDAMGQGELQRLAGVRAQAPVTAARAASGRGSSTRIIDVVL